MFLFTSVSIFVLYLLSYFLGRWSANKNKKVIVALSLLYSFHFLFAQYLHRDSRIEFNYFDNIIYGYLGSWWDFFALFYFGGLVVVRTKKLFLRKLFDLLLLCVIVQFFYSRYDIYALYFVCGNQPDSRGYCLQSTSFTCGPAAASTLLSQYQIPSTEKEMIRLCHTDFFTGTNSFLLKDCLNVKLKQISYPGKFELKSFSVEQIGDYPMPFIAAVKYNAFVDHLIVALGYDGQRIKVFDPLKGEISYDKETLKSIWLKNCLILRPNN